MEYADIDEIVEVDCGDDFGQVNKKLQAGWRLLRVRLVGKKEGHDYVEYPIYILGRSASISEETTKPLLTSEVITEIKKRAETK